MNQGKTASKRLKAFVRMNNRISMKYDVKEAQGQQKTETCGEP